MAQKHTAALLFPKSIMLDRIGIHGLERSAMKAFVGLLVAVQAEFAGHDRSCERPLVARACDVERRLLFRLSLPFFLVSSSSLFSLFPPSSSFFSLLFLSSLSLSFFSFPSSPRRV